MKTKICGIKISGLIWLMLFSVCACSQPEKNKKTKKEKETAPVAAAFPGYDLGHPEVFRMTPVLDEISGISIRQAHGDTLFAIQDEDGYLFRFLPGAEQVGETKFGKKGDYEDVQLLGSFAIVLRSDGRLYRFPLENPDPKKADVVEEQKELLPRGEYEGLYADEKNKQVFVLCKHCDEKTNRVNSVFAFDISDAGEWKSAGEFSIDVKKIESLAGERKVDFHPSAFTRNEATGEWYILSSVNKMLVVADKSWQPLSVIPLPAELFNQPEGIAIDNKGTLYISNEKGSSSAATVLKFVHH